MSLAGWVNSLTHPLAQKNHLPTPTHSITSETMTTFADKMGWSSLKAFEGNKKRNWHKIIHI